MAAFNTSAGEDSEWSPNEMMNGVEAGKADDDEIDRDHVVQEPRHEQDQHTGNQGGQRRDVGDGQMHQVTPGWGPEGET